MKKSKIYTLVMFAFMTFGFALTARAQFPSSDKVYCYQYVKTVDNGVITKDDKEPLVYFICFYGEWAGEAADRSSKVGEKMVSEPDYYNSKAIEEARSSRINNSPNELWGHYYLRYNNSYSTSSKVTYRGWFDGGREINWDSGSPKSVYKSAGWLNYCYSFSLDKSEMIFWFIDNPNKREYYKLIDPKSLKPNLDFLD
ncbi:MAG: hypothetical protein II856_00640 [Bacteroidales bacterium]|nr:hypothetical protein [Bacteroidales bacterium]